MEGIAQGLSIVNNGLTLTKSISEFISRNKVNKIRNQAEIAYLKEETKKLLIIAKNRNAGEIFTVNIDELVKAQETINHYVKLGLLNGPAYDMALQHLDTLNRELQRNLEDYKNGRSW